MRHIWVLPVILIHLALFAGELTVSIPLDPSAIRVNGPEFAAWITGQDMNLIDQVGAPTLPVYTERIALPPGCAATSMQIIDARYEQMRGRFEILPKQPQVPLSRMDEQLPEAIPDPAIYDSGEFYPSTPADFRGSSVLLGIPVAYLRVNPARWNPASGTMELLTALTVRLTYENRSDASTVLRRSSQSEERSIETVRNMVANPEGVLGSGASIVDSRSLAYGEYVIIASSDYAAYAQELADWKTSKGVPASVYTLDWIESHYSFYDQPQDIRAFLTDCRDEGVEYVLIYGDDNIIAGRDAQVTNGVTPDYPPVDLYWSDINDMVPGADLWDSNNNHIWAQFGIDEVDYHPDLWVGRASVNTTGECQIFNQKVLDYERVNQTDYFEDSPVELRIGYTTELLWPGCYGSAGAELISQYVPSGWEEEKCYDSNGTNSVAKTDSMLNAGPHHVYHSSHGSATAFSLPGGVYTCADFMNLHNISDGGLPAIWNSISCEIGHLDGYECMGDAWNDAPNGGGFGAFNARYGWGNPSNPGYGTSEILARYFYDVMWNDDLYNLGVAHAMGSDQMAPPGGFLEDWSIKEYNLFGDPELPMWFVDAPELDADHPSSINQAGTVTVTVTSDGSPVNGARVCLQKGDWKSGEIYQVENTDPSGQCSFYVNPQSTGSISVVAWARDHISYIGEIEVTGTGIEGTSIGGPSNSIMAACPSPANSSTTVPFTLASAGRVNVDVYDLSGRNVSTLFSGQLSGGENSVVWDLTDGEGRPVPSGLYTVRVSSSDWTGNTQLLVVR